MRKVIIESPYASDDPETQHGNVLYARHALLDCLTRGESPLASHLLYTQVLNDGLVPDRKLGIEAGLAWMEVADLVAFYVDRSWSKGMLDALGRARVLGKPHEARSLTRRSVELPR